MCKPSGVAIRALGPGHEGFLYGAWRAGALAGSTLDDAFYVHGDRATRTRNDFDDGRVICEIGVAATCPAKFVIVRVGQEPRIEALG